jgi:PAS domain S-box-containing protein
MSSMNDQYKKGPELRRRAEPVARDQAAGSAVGIERTPTAALQTILQELQVRQTELELQNEELRRRQLGLEASRAHEFDIWDLAPIGYYALSEQGLILQTNLTAAVMFGVTRDALLKQPFSRFVHSDDADIFHLQRNLLSVTGEPQAFELQFMKVDGTTFWGHLAARVVQITKGVDLMVLMLSDITPLKLMEESLKDLARYPTENPNPILRIDREGCLLYANSYAQGLLTEWHLLIGQPAPAELGQAVERAFLDNRPCEIVSRHDGRDWLTVVTAITGTSYANLYCVDITERRLHEESLRKLNEELEDRVRARTSLLERISARMLSAQEDERKRVAMELHDSLGQTLSALSLMGGQVMAGSCAEGRAGHMACAPAMMTVLHGAIEEVRRISMDLRPSMLDDLGLLPTISWLIRNFQNANPSIKVRKRIKAEEQAIPKPLKITLFRIMQEAFHNTQKHGHASEIVFALATARGSLTMKISDNGRGFDTETARSSGDAGLGLTSMQERTEFSGGTFTLASSPGSGTQIVAHWPLPDGEGAPSS